MTDNQDNNSTQNPAQSSQGSDSQSSQEDAQFVTKDEFDKVVNTLTGLEKSNGFFQSSIRDIKKMLEGNTSSDKSDSKKTDPNQSKSDQALQEINALKKQLAEKEAREQALQTESFAIKRFGDEFARGMLAEYWKGNGSRWVIGKNDKGEQTLVDRDNEWVTFQDEIARLEKEIPTYLRNKGVDGTGVMSKGDISKGQTLSQAQLNRLSPSERQEFFKNNPEQAKKALDGFSFG